MAGMVSMAPDPVPWPGRCVKREINTAVGILTFKVGNALTATT
jgi:hypothetical protein